MTEHDRTETMVKLPDHQAVAGKEAAYRRRCNRSHGGRGLVHFSADWHNSRERPLQNMDLSPSFPPCERLPADRTRTDWISAHGTEDICRSRITWRFVARSVGPVAVQGQLMSSPGFPSRPHARTLRSDNYVQGPHEPGGERTCVVRLDSHTLQSACRREGIGFVAWAASPATY